VPKSDVKFTYIEPQFDGWLYSVEEMNLQGLVPETKEAWDLPLFEVFLCQSSRNFTCQDRGLESWNLSLTKQELDNVCFALNGIILAFLFGLFRK
jgi:hypothetical protein